MIAAMLMALAISGDDPLPDARAEARAQSLMREIRCIVCENEPVSNSASDPARDMRREIREQVMKGETDAHIREFFARGYGQFVLFRPSANGAGLMIWLFPFSLLALAGAALGVRAIGARRGGKAAEIQAENADAPVDL